MTLRLKANRRFPSVPVVTDNTANHTQVLMAVKEALDIGQRRTSDLLNSFIRVEDLIDLGLITFEGNTTAIVGADLSEIASIGDLSGAAAGDFLRFDGSEWVNDQLAPGDITQTMVTQHQAALSIAWSQITGEPTIPAELNDLTDVYLSSPPSVNDVLTWDGSSWVASPPPAGGSVYLDDVLDVDAPYPNSGDVLTWDGYNWVNDTPAASGNTFSPGTRHDYFHDFIEGVDSTSMGIWDQATSGGTVTYNSTEEDHPGIAILATSTTIDSYGQISLSTNIASATAHRQYRLGTTELVFETLVYFPDLPATGARFTGCAGLVDGTTRSNLVQAILTWDTTTSSQRWQLWTRNGGVNVSSTASFGATANTWHHVRLVMTSTQIDMYVDGVLAATNTTSIPTTSLTPGYACFQGTVGGAAREMRVDCVWMHKEFATPRSAYFSS